VTYLVDPHGTGTERAIPEEVVLRRWRRRRFPGYEFSGARLSPTVWRALPALFGPDIEQWLSADAGAIDALRVTTLPALRARHLSTPDPETLRALLRACGLRGIKALIARHTSAEHQGHSGVPDLFLFATDRKGRVAIPRFVEVKKPAERISTDQTNEIRFMQSLGLHARVLILVERSHTVTESSIERI
jgi:hypothetical protein